MEELVAPPTLDLETCIQYMKDQKVDAWKMTSNLVTVHRFKNRLRRKYRREPDKLQELLKRVDSYVSTAHAYEVVGPDGSEGFRVIHREKVPAYVCGLPVLSNGDVVLVGEAHHAIRFNVTSIPAITIGPPTGVPRAGENTIDCVRREVEQETRLQVNTVIPLAKHHSPVCGARRDVHLLPHMVRLVEPFAATKLPVARGEVVRACIFEPRELRRLVEHGQYVQEVLWASLVGAFAYSQALRERYYGA